MDTPRLAASPSPDVQPQLSYRLKRQTLKQDPAFGAVFTAVYEELRRIAAFLRNQERYCILAPTEIVHDAFLKLGGSSVPDIENKQRFKRIATVAMRQILVDAARSRDSLKRGGDVIKVTLSDALGVTVSWDETLLDLDRRLDELGDFAPRVAEAVDMHFFGGCTLDEIAKHQEVALSTVQRDLRSGLAWLGMKVKPEEPPRKSA